MQPFAYLQLVFVTLMAIPVFGETLEPKVALGATIVIGAGLFTAWRERQAKQGEGQGFSKTLGKFL